MVKILTLATSIIVFAGCTEQNTFVSSVRETVQLQGTVQSWVCGTWDPWTYPPKPFVERTGEHPRLTVIYTDNTTETFTVDDSSQFFHPLIPGPCKIAVNTRFTYPADTFRFYIDNDTAISLDIVLRVIEADTMIVLFQYSTMPDSTTLLTEWAVIELLNAHLGGAFRDDGANPRIEWHHYSNIFNIYSYWHMPLKDSTLNVLEIYYQAQEIVDADTVRFKNMYLYPNGVYGCQYARSDSSTIASPIVDNE